MLIRTTGSRITGAPNIKVREEKPGRIRHPVTELKERIEKSKEEVKSNA